MRALAGYSRSEEHTSELQSHSDLHSFPTRRSSDLCGRDGQSARGDPGWALARNGRGDRVDVLQQRGGRSPRLPHGDRRAAGAAARAPRCRLADRSCARWPATADRKSTRLNSSHTVIYTLSLHDALPIFVGGMGSLPGAILGGLLLGTVEGIGSTFFSSAAVEVLGFLMVIAVLLARPRGLLGAA